jgi:hypothetical protein
MLVVSTVLTIVELELKMSTMPSSLPAMEMTMERISGTLKTHGELLGEIKDSSKWKEESTCALLLNVTLTHLLKNHSVSQLLQCEITR